ncbi:MAG TPA: hypothetical protein EYP67_03480 [Methanosarcinales archaeon]|nr:hypothetical protein [Methanosarcinales archaeon]
MKMRVCAQCLPAAIRSAIAAFAATTVCFTSLDAGGVLFRSDACHYGTIPAILAIEDRLRKRWRGGERG